MNDHKISLAKCIAYSAALTADDPRPAYLSDRLIPVADLVRDGDPQPDLPGLESYCDGGACFL